MKELIKINKVLHLRLMELMDEHGYEKNFIMKAFYHSGMANGGKYQSLYQAFNAHKE